VVGTTVLLLVAVAVTAMAFIKVPYVIISPGDATALDGGIVSISGARTYPHKGELLYLTVRVSNSDPNVWRWLFAKLDSDVSVEKRENVIGCATYGDSASLQDELIRQSKDIAQQVALRRLGYDVPEVGTSIAIRDVLCGGPSDGLLHVGDRITSVDAAPVHTSDDVGPLIKAKARGEVVRLTVERNGKSREVAVELGQRDGAGFLGIVSQTLFDWQFPVDVKIDTEQVSGPSAGLAFTLAIIDALTPGDLTGARKVAVSGEMAVDGSVQPVGGVEQKAVAARENGASLMLVPPGEARAARDHADGMKVIEVRTIDDALRALEQGGGKPVAAPPSTTATTAPPGQ
jgi:PDZ domain-containing protein